MNRSPRRTVFGYALAVATVLAMAGLRAALDPVLGDTAPLVLFLIPVMLTAWIGGLGPGMVATGLALAVGMALFGPDRHPRAEHGMGFHLLVRGAPLATVGTGISLFAAGLERARGRAVVAADRAVRAEDASRRIFDSVTEFAIFTTDLWGRITSWNPGAERVFGYARGAAIGQPAAMLFTPEDRAAGVPEQEMATAAAAGRAGDDRWHVRRDGTRFFASGTVTPLRDAGGAHVGFTKVCRDVTESHDARQQLAEVKRRSESALLAGDMGTFDWDVSSDHVGGDANFHRIFATDMPADGLMPLTTYTGAIHPDDRDRVGRQVAHSVATGADYECEYRLRLAGRPDRWILARGRMVLDDAGRVVRFPGVVIDNTTRKADQTALVEAEARYRELFTSMDEGYCVLEMLYDGAGVPVDFRYELVNPAFEAQTGIANGAGRTVSEIAPGLDGHWVEAYGRVAETGRPTRFTEDAAALGRVFEVFAFRVGGEGSRRVGVLFTNVTDRRRAERDRESALATERQLRSVAEQAGRIKDDFLATISHELRTPLNAIVGWAQLMADGADGVADAETVREGIAVIGRNAALQSRLIEDILDVSRVTSGKLRIAAHTIDLRDPVAAAIETVRTGAAARHIDLAVDLGDAPVQVTGDVDRLQQVFWNLVANAIKFSDKGGRVVVAMRRTESRATVTVTDGGRGMSADFLPYVFDRFRQADMSTTRRAGGLGLGLSIVRHLAELHGGTVSADSNGEGHGSTFTVELPLTAVLRPTDDVVPTRSAVATKVPTPASAVSLAGLRVLTLDDEPDARRVVQVTLTRYGAEVTVVGSVADAIGVLTAAHHGIDVVLSDIGMPGEDGYAFIRRLRHLEQQRGLPHLPTVALTALTRPADRTGVLAAGFDDYLPKPVQPDELITVIARLADV